MTWRVLLFWRRYIGGSSREVLWLREGNNCTKFLHRVANLNRKNNSIEQRVINGTVSSDQSQISDHIVQFFDRLFTRQFSWWAQVGWPYF